MYGLFEGNKYKMKYKKEIKWDEPVHLPNEVDNAKKLQAPNWKGDLVDIFYTEYWNATSNKKNCIYCGQLGLVSLDIPEDLEYIICHSNLIKELVIHDKVKVLQCDKGVKLIGDLDRSDLIIFMI